MKKDNRLDRESEPHIQITCLMLYPLTYRKPYYFLVQSLECRWWEKLINTQLLFEGK